MTVVVVVVVVAAVGILSLVTTPRYSTLSDAPCSNNGPKNLVILVVHHMPLCHKVLLRVQMF